MGETAEYRRDRMTVLLWICLSLSGIVGGLATLLWANLSSQVQANTNELHEQRVKIRELEIYRDTNRETLERIERYMTALAAKQGVTLPP